MASVLQGVESTLVFFDKGVAMERGHALKGAEAAILMASSADGRSLGEDLATPRASTAPGSFVDAIALGGCVHGD